MFISLDDIQRKSHRWENTSYLRTDGKTEYREKPEYGNLHVVFEINAVLGSIHEDKFNATNFPIGTIRHTGKYVEEKTGIPEKATSIVIGLLSAVALFAGYRYLK